MALPAPNHARNSEMKRTSVAMATIRSVWDHRFASNLNDGPTAAGGFGDSSGMDTPCTLGEAGVVRFKLLLEPSTPRNMDMWFCDRRRFLVRTAQHIAPTGRLRW